MERVFTGVTRLVCGEGGQDLLEYALLAALIAIVVMAGITTLGQTINTVFWQNFAQSI